MGGGNHPGNSPGGGSKSALARVEPHGTLAPPRLRQCLSPGGGSGRAIANFFLGLRPLLFAGCQAHPNSELEHRVLCGTRRVNVLPKTNHFHLKGWKCRFGKGTLLRQLRARHQLNKANHSLHVGSMRRPDENDIHKCQNVAEMYATIS